MPICFLCARLFSSIKHTYKHTHTHLYTHTHTHTVRCFPPANNANMCTHVHTYIHTQHTFDGLTHAPTECTHTHQSTLVHRETHAVDYVPYILKHTHLHTQHTADRCPPIFVLQKHTHTYTQRKRLDHLSLRARSSWVVGAKKDYDKTLMWHPASPPYTFKTQTYDSREGGGSLRWRCRGVGGGRAAKLRGATSLRASGGGRGEYAAYRESPLAQVWWVRRVYV